MSGRGCFLPVVEFLISNRNHDFTESMFVNSGAPRRGQDHSQTPPELDFVQNEEGSRDIAAVL
jgi:hypothetical protein